MSEQPTRQMNAQQMDALANKVRDAINAAIRNMELRKWAMEQTMSRITPGYNVQDPIAFAKSVHDFIVQPDVPIVVKIEQ